MPPRSPALSASASVVRARHISLHFSEKSRGCDTCNYGRLGQNTVANELATIGSTHNAQNWVKSGVCMPGESFDAIELDCTVVALQGTIELQMNQDLCLK